MSGPFERQGWSNKGQSRPGAGGVWSALVEFDGVVAYWRRLYPANTAAHVAADLGAPVETAKKWILRAADPSGKWLLSAIAFYGPDLIAAGLKRAPDWLDRLARDRRAAELDHEIETLIARRHALDAPGPALSASALRPAPPRPGKRA